jgi:hypothetical protein
MMVCILADARYKPGDQAPEGYLAWHEWAEVQHKAGLRQKQCGRCGLWRYPQQLSAEVDRAGVTVETSVCNDCHKPPNVGAKWALHLSAVLGHAGGEARK